MRDSYIDFGVLRSGLHHPPPRQPTDTGILCRSRPRHQCVLPPAPVSGGVYDRPGQSLVSETTMPRAQRTWVYSPPKPPAPKVPASTKAEVQDAANHLIETVLKPQHVKPAPTDARFNYLVNISTKWYRHYFYFSATYAVPGPNAIAPFFETKFARMEYAEENRFNLSFMRHTGEWIELYRGVSLDECLEHIKDDPFFYP